ncbi:hypothetical protein BHYA_0499g00010 [Botrytis hyacinthi]|uniref:Uncharacterized protein n=1 Tax=Botrytis hyacinthi TaxID=278943 RepID=A0A4Z1GBK6_9HELO|nr:hypothetical protein BHYA_0499g00010 [Botrytis hyacinthi]
MYRFLKKAEKKIPVYTKNKVFVAIVDRKGNELSLPSHNMIYEPLYQGNFISFVYLVFGKLNTVIIKNPTDKEIIVYKNLKLEDVIDSNA